MSGVPLQTMAVLLFPARAPGRFTGFGEVTGGAETLPGDDAAARMGQLREVETALPDQRLDFAQPPGERVDLLHVVVPDLDLVPGELAKARQRADGVVIVVEDRDLHPAAIMPAPRAGRDSAIIAP